MEQTNNCPHRYTFTRDHLFAFNPLFSKKKCELCGKTIVMDAKYKVFIVLFITALIIVLINVPMLLNAVLPVISYFAKGLIAILAFVLIYAFGIYKIMSIATYHAWSPAENGGTAAFERAQAKATHRTEGILKKSDGDHQKKKVT